MRLTAAQALVRFLAAQHVERDGVRHRFFGGCFGIFGHGNVAGIGEALLRAPRAPHLPPGAQRAGDGAHGGRLSRGCGTGSATLACTTSIGPGATNMVTGAALATVNRLPVLLLPGRRVRVAAPDPVLQQLEVPSARRRLGQRLLPAGVALLRPDRAARAGDARRRSRRCACSSNQAETGAVTLAFPQDVQAEAFDFPDELLRAARLARPAAACPTQAALARAAELDPRRAAAADRRRRRRHLLRGDRRAARASSSDRHPGRRDAGRQGLAALRPSRLRSARSA